MTLQRSVVVVEDDDAIRELLLFALESHGYDVRAARDGMEALDDIVTSVFFGRHGVLSTYHLVAAPEPEPEPSSCAAACCTAAMSCFNSSSPSPPYLRSVSASRNASCR